MKKITIILPLLALLMTGCKTSESSEVSLPASESSELSSSPSTVDPSLPGSSQGEERKEFNPTELNAIFGSDLYSKLPKIYSNDYDIFDEASADYPVDIYIDFHDWTEEDAIAYDNALLAAFTYDEVYGSIIQENLYVYIYLDEDNYDPGVYGINIYSVADETEPVEKEEIDPTELNAIFGSDISTLR